MKEDFVPVITLVIVFLGFVLYGFGHYYGSQSERNAIIESCKKSQEYVMEGENVKVKCELFLK